MNEVEQSVQRACGVRRRKLIPALFAEPMLAPPGRVGHNRYSAQRLPHVCTHRRGCAAAPARVDTASPQAPPARSLHVQTPLIHSNELTQALGTGAPVFLKLENVQPSGSFKLRGIGAACAATVSAGASTLVSSSGGYAGLAVAYSARAVGVKCVVVRADAAALALCCTISVAGVPHRWCRAPRLSRSAPGWRSMGPQWLCTASTGRRRTSRRRSWQPRLAGLPRH